MNALTLLIAPPSPPSDYVKALVKEARAKSKNLREDSEREAIAVDVVEVRPFGDAEESLSDFRRES